MEGMLEVVLERPEPFGESMEKRLKTDMICSCTKDPPVYCCNGRGDTKLRYPYWSDGENKIKGISLRLKGGVMKKWCSAQKQWCCEDKFDVKYPDSVRSCPSILVSLHS